MPPKKSSNGYKFCEPLPKGEILTDKSNKKWKLGISIGKGGFGEIYSAKPFETSSKEYQNVIKIEPHTNGPLFVEMHFYIRNCKPEEIQDFINKKKIKTFGMPLFFGSGSHDYKGEKYRFLVLEKYGTDLWKLFLGNNKQFPEVTVFQIAIQILDILEYIHSRGYVHADIKGANILLGITKETKNKQVYLLDFGLATKFSTEKEFKPNPKRAHDGTIEYLSRDAHQGVQTRRGDLEILFYNMIQWLGCTLPWEGKVSNPKTVNESKESHMDSFQKISKACFGSNNCPDVLLSYFKYLKTLQFNTEPDYEKIKKILLKGIKDAGGVLNQELVFSNKKPDKLVSNQKSTPKKRKQSENEATTKKGQKPKADSESTMPTKSSPKKLKSNSKEIEKNTANEALAGYTDAMREVLRKKKENDQAKKTKKSRRATVDIPISSEDMEDLGIKKINTKRMKTVLDTATIMEPKRSKRLFGKNSRSYNDNASDTEI
ncbi:unnamed protein product [Brassicogethes aeneus]|uniref:non-specific serine/threonine protein kinase n=1 Tax=Brassicogethes aeneus TaxID=1431903 RepID=A0A9P0AYF6_BRAAE|nr:unnamed protein product [Brassicogethes aeneus]